MIRQVKAKDAEIYMKKGVYSGKSKREPTQALAAVDFSEIYSVHGTQSFFYLFMENSLPCWINTFRK